MKILTIRKWGTREPLEASMSLPNDLQPAPGAIFNNVCSIVYRKVHNRDKKVQKLTLTNL